MRYAMTWRHTQANLERAERMTPISWAPWIKIDQNASPPEESESEDHEISQDPISGTSFAA
jgi:hypothetical protein